MASVRMLRILLLSLSVGRQLVSVTAITGLQIRRHYRLRPKPEKVVSVGLYMLRYSYTVQPEQTPLVHLSATIWRQSEQENCRGARELWALDA